MAIFPGTKEDNILAWRGISAFVEELRAHKAETLSVLDYEEGGGRLRELRDRFDEEIAFEGEIAARWRALREELGTARSGEQLALLLPRFDRLTEDYFRRRESVIACHDLANTYRDSLVHKALQLAEEVVEADTGSRPPVPFCLLAAGSTGRLEQTFCNDPSWFLVHGDVPAAESYSFTGLTERTAQLLHEIGIVRNAGLRNSVPRLWTGSRTTWRRELEDLGKGEQQRLFELIRRADLRAVSGESAFATEAIDTAWAVLEHRNQELRETSRMMAVAARTRAAFSFPLPSLREMGKGLAEGLDFFSRFRLQRSGRHRGKVDLAQSALDPLIANVRMLAINFGLRETSTVGRIRRLQELGHLSVELTERLLYAYHDFTRFKIDRQLAGECEKESECFIDPHSLADTEKLQLTHALEAVSGLEKIAYVRFGEQG